jgi:arylsulfatase A-like enzyme
MRFAAPSLVALAGATACSGGGPRSVLLITLDTTRADALGAYGRVPSVTPHLDALAAEGVVFEQAYTVAPLTLPAHASMLTGLYPPRHGVRDNGLAALPQAAETAAERARAAGVQTAAFLGSVVLDQGFGLEQGFETYQAPARSFYNGPTMGFAERGALDVARLASEWLQGRDRKRPFFLWAHLWDAHAPYRPAPGMKKRAGGDDYLGEVVTCDDAVGRLVAALKAEKLLDSTTILVVADHGEAFGEHGEISHGPFVWQATLRVPLILRLAGERRSGTRVGSVASAVDVCPTVLDALELEPPEGLDGVSLLDDSPAAKRGTYFESYYGHFNFGWHPLVGWVDASAKLIHGPQARFFELAHDPGEEHDLAAERAERVAQFRGAIGEVAGRPALARDAEGLDPELRKTLQGVGYAAIADEGTSVPAVLAELELPDPLACLQELADFQAAEGWLAAEKYPEAERSLRRLVEAHPHNPFAWDRLALCLMRMNRHAEALSALEHVLAETSGNADTWCYVGACRLVIGDEEKALTAFRRALELDPNHVQALGGLIHLMEAAGMASEAAPLKKRFEAVQSRP